MARGGYRHYLNRLFLQGKITEAQARRRLAEWNQQQSRMGRHVAHSARGMWGGGGGGKSLSPREQTIAQRRSQPYPKKPPEVAAREDKQIREARQRQMVGSIPAGRGWVGSKDELEAIYDWKKKKAIGHTGTSAQQTEVQKRITQWVHGKEDVRDELERAWDNTDADKPAFSDAPGVVGVDGAEEASKYFERSLKRWRNANRARQKWGGHVMPHKRHRVVESDIDLPRGKTVQPVGPVDPLDPRVPEPVREKAHVFVPAGSKWEKSYINKKARRGLQKQAARQKIWKRANALAMERKRRLWLRGLKRNPYV